MITIARRRSQGNKGIPYLTEIACGVRSQDPRMRQKYRIVLGTTTFSKPMRLNANTAPINSNIGLTKIPVIWIHNRAHTDTHSLKIRAHTDTRSLKIRAHTDTHSHSKFVLSQIPAHFIIGLTQMTAHFIIGLTQIPAHFVFFKSGSHRYPSLLNGPHKDTYHFKIGITKIPFASQIGMKKIPLGFGFYFLDTPSRQPTISTQEKDNKDTVSTPTKC